eukprot:Blabericola_migrator_1__245@NODE_1065_length_5548_cov_186_921182_g732_i0_p4_GENE_NODE_1065_length_5548_cov_186_921182_g732_i0NODE_1065_length_5548_cov_186_921182_g732_i0_p4_ORF_typecomplete_len170_score21_72DNA_pol3_chi/PF04364_13/0_065DUF11/PF01345_18/32DUF11/PF01345_18/7_1_NODE_1065_length_5548_cov_186_921182_g732_i040114520
MTWSNVPVHDFTACPICSAIPVEETTQYVRSVTHRKSNITTLVTAPQADVARHDTWPEYVSHTPHTMKRAISFPVTNMSSVSTGSPGRALIRAPSEARATEPVEYTIQIESPGVETARAVLMTASSLIIDSCDDSVWEYRLRAFRPHGDALDMSSGGTVWLSTTDDDAS